jgi:hypothetical protein
LRKDFGGTPFFFTGSKGTAVNAPSVTTLYKNRRLVRIARGVVYQLGLGDNIEIFGRK